MTNRFDPVSSKYDDSVSEDDDHPVLPYDDFAYFTLVMLGDSYVEPALVLGRSIQSSRTRVKRRYCMVTRDVSSAARDLLKHYWTVVEVEYYTRGNLPSLTDKIHGSWMKHSFTKLAFFRLARDLNVKHCLYMDADTVVLRNLDHMFIEFDRILNNPRVNLCFVTSFYPFFRNGQYYNGQLMREVSRFERKSRRSNRNSISSDSSKCGDELYYCPINWDHLLDVWNNGLGLTTRDEEIERSRNGSIALPPHKKSTTSTRHFPYKGRDRYFLCNTSMMFVCGKNAQTFDRLVVSLEKQLNDPKNLLFRFPCFSSGWVAQLLMQILIDTLDDGVRLYHLRSLYNVNCGFRNQCLINSQPFTMTWWGTDKPWKDCNSVPMYTDVYLFRYFRQQVAGDLGEKFMGTVS